MVHEGDAVPGPTDRRRLSLPWFAVVAVAYLAIIQVGGRLAQQIWDSGDGFTSTRDVVVNMWVPLGVALAFVYGVVAVLGWWEPVLRERHPVQRWVWVVPLILVISIVLATDYAALGDTSVGFVLALVVGTQLVGWGEEGMFRGIGVTSLRDRGLTEGRVAVWSSVVFGAAHLTNALGHGSQAIVQAVAVSFAGYFFYLTRRVSGGNVLNSVLHGFFDFGLLTGTAILVDQSAYVGSLAAILAYVAIAAALIVRRGRIEPSVPVND